MGIIPLISLIGLILGAVGGYIYYAKVGCVSGTCAITSNPWMSAAWGAAFGYLVFDMFSGKKTSKASESNS
ncbi:MAG: hypothetical protein JW731_17820 [Bacteroidales bacterium]|nr:hypothetical protein [Bacteroidales bacterium]